MSGLLSECFRVLDHRACRVGPLRCLTLFGASSTLNQFNSLKALHLVHPLPSICQTPTHLPPPFLRLTTLYQHTRSASNGHAADVVCERYFLSIRSNFGGEAPVYSRGAHIVSLEAPGSITELPVAPSRLVTGIGEASGDVVQSPTLRPNHHPTSMKRSSLLLSSYIGPRPKQPLPEFVHCMCFKHALVPLVYTFDVSAGTK